MIDEIVLTYSDFKVIATKKKFFWQLLETESSYTIWGYDLPTKYSTKILRVNPSIGDLDFSIEEANVTDFETNYKAGCNRPNAISPTAAQTQFYGKSIELAVGVAEEYCEWSFESDTFINKVLPQPIAALKGDTIDFEVWAKPGIFGPEPVKADQYAFGIPVFGSNPMPWIYGSGGGLIPHYCTIRCYYRRTDTSELRDFNVIAEYLV